MTRPLSIRWCVTSLILLVLGNSVSSGQESPPKLNLFDQLGGVPAGGGFGGLGDKVTITARIVADKGGPAGKLEVTADIEPEWHLYSVTQPAGGPLPTKLDLQSNPKIEVLAKFQPDKPAKVRRVEEYPGIDIEEHADKVVWTAPVRLPSGVDPAQWDVKLKFSGLACRDADSCLPVRQTVKVQLVGFQAAPATPPPAEPAKKEPAAEPKPAAATKSAPAVPAEAAPFIGKPGPFRPKLAHATINGRINAKSAAPGSTIPLVITAEPSDKWHIYAYAKNDRDAAGPFKPTLIGLKLPPGWTAEAARPDSPPVSKTGSDGQKSTYHEKTVNWTVSVHIPADAPRGPQTIVGVVGLQTCDARTCEPPQGVAFQAEIEVADAALDGTVPLLFAAAKYEEASDLAKGGAAAEAVVVGGAPAPKTDSAAKPAATKGGGGSKWNVSVVATEEEKTSLASALFFALLGGFSLNFMPCVLPVIGLKIVAFVHQSHGDRRRVFLLNLVYSLGLLAVFMVLATLAVVFQLGWGEQFQSTGFNITLVSVVFVFALSMLGVWEIPIPGFMGTGKVAEAAENEGLFGAFAKGAFTTMLATPCTGPFMGSALTWAFKQPAPVVFATFFALGVGMAFPYLVIGAFPQLMRFLPKPGAWMDTFKQVMGFVLLGTVVFMIGFIRKDYVIPTAALLLGLGVACWWIGRTSIFAELGQKVLAWAVGSALAAAIGWLGFTFLGPSEATLPWKTFDRAVVEQLVAEGKTVMVDFTADWCLNCKTNEAVALNTKKTLALVKSNEVVAIKADKTHDDELGEAVDQFLLELGHTSRSIPFLVIFPANGEPPKAFHGPVTQGMVSQALREAGPSRTAGAAVGSLTVR